MAISRVSLVTESLLTRFNALSSGDTSVRGGGSNTPSSVTQLGGALRVGSRAYTSAFNNLNTAFSALNISESSLEQLGEVVDEMISLVDRAKNSSTSRQARINYDSDFRDLVTDFRKIVEDTELDSAEVLTEEGLKSLLTSVGLDEETSSSIARAFEKIVTPVQEDSLGSEKQKGARPVRLPVVPVQTNTTYLEGNGDALSSATVADPLTTGFISSGFNVYEQDANVGSSTTITIESTDGGTTNTLVVATGADLLAVNDSNGYSVIESSADHVGYNTNLRPNLFLVDTTGTVVQQITDNQTDAGMSFTNADLANDNLSVAYNEISGVTGDLNVRVATSSTFGTDPSTSTVTDIETVAAGGFIDDLQLSDDGNYVAFSRASGSETLRFYDVATQTVDAFLAGITNNETFGFVDNNQLVVLSNNGEKDLLREYTYNDLAFGNTISSGYDVSSIATLQKDDTYSYAVAFQNAGNNDLYVVDETGNQLQRINLAATANETSLTRAYSGGIEVGATGYFGIPGGDDLDQLYRFEGDREATITYPPDPSILTEDGDRFGDVAFGDFDGDGNVDIIATSTISSEFSIFLGNGNGTFNDEVTIATSETPGAVAVADIDGDGALDVLITNTVSEDLGVFLGNGDGTFASESLLGLGNGPQGLQTGDFDNDGNIDIVTADSLDGILSVALGNGDGSFAASVSYALAVGVDELAVSDFNNDGILDLAAVNGDTDALNILTGDGDGTFTADAALTPGAGPSAIVAADFNSDGNIDLATADETDDTLSIFLGNGNGTFGARTSFATGTDPTDLVTVDYNGDGALDLVSVNNGSNSISYFAGFGDGNFPAAQTNSSATASPLAIAAADINEDGVIDFATGAGGGTSALGIYLTQTQANSNANAIVDSVTTKESLPAGDQNYTDIFDTKRSLTSRADSFFLAADLEALREQITDNIEAIQEIKEVVSANIDVSIAAANSFLERANNLTSASTADSVSRLLSNDIRKETGRSAQFVHDIESIAIAGLVSSGDIEI